MGHPGPSTDVQCGKAHKSVIPLEKKKYLDLFSLCNNETCPIPKMYHDVFKTVPHDEQQQKNDEDDLSFAALCARLLNRKRRRN